MRYIRLLLFSLLVLSLIITFISFFFPSHVHVSRAIAVRADKDLILNQVAKPENWRNWFPGADSSTLYIKNGQVKGLITKSKEVLIVTNITDSTVTAESTGLKAGKGNMYWNIIFSEHDPAITIQWGMNFDLEWYPWEKFSGLLLDKVYGQRMERGLAKLKEQVEN